MWLQNEEQINDSFGCCMYKLCHYKGDSGGGFSEGGGSAQTNSTTASCDGVCPQTNGWAGYGFGNPIPLFSWDLTTSGPQSLR